MIVHSQFYSSDYDPPAPVLDVYIRAAGRSAPKVKLTGLVDSGADGTMIPTKILKKLGASFVGTRRMRGVTGRAITVQLYSVVIAIGPHTVFGIHAVGTKANQTPILGRDFLNQLNIGHNGLAEVIEVSN